ncbi:MAG TPA: hypothetical protein VHV75_01130 [Solirubrobacteraceae bacterium]|nr:hypothetical protein [Solirubrobacteraceae bacterium]
MILPAATSTPRVRLGWRPIVSAAAIVIALCACATAGFSLATHLSKDSTAGLAQPLVNSALFPSRVLGGEAALAVSFTAAGAEVRAGGARLGLRATSLSAGGKLEHLRRAMPRSHGLRTSYALGDLREWFLQREGGLEQGFTVSARPSGGAGSLAVTLRVSGNLRASRAGDAIIFTHAGRPVLTYGELEVSDATGRRLSASLSIEGTRLRINIDTSGARFPLRIDPMLQQTSFDDGVEQVGATYAPLDYGVSSDGSEIATVTGNGEATVFTEPAGGWVSGAPAQATVSAPSSSVSSWSYGQSTFASISPDGNTLYLEFVGTTSNQESTLPPGYIYIYTRNGGTWQESGSLSGGAGYTLSPYGLTVSGDGSTIVAGGAYADTPNGDSSDPNPTPGSPAAPYFGLLIFKRASGSWAGVSTQAAATPSSDDVPWQWAVSADGSTIAVETIDGADAHDEDDIVFTDNGSSQISLAASGSVGISGDGSVIAVGESGVDGAGFVDVFERPGSGWTSIGALASRATLTDSVAGAFGNAVAVSSDGSVIYVNEVPSAPEPGLTRAVFNGNGFDTYSEPEGGWSATMSSPTYTWTPTTYSSGISADTVDSLELSADDSTLVSLGQDCAAASSANDYDCVPGVFVFSSDAGSTGTTSSTTTATSTAAPTSTAATTAVVTSTSSSNQSQTSTGTDTTIESTCPASDSPSSDCETGIGEPRPDGNSLNLPANCNFAATDGVSCTYSSGAYQISSSACQSGCAITTSQAEQAANAAVQSFLSSIGATSLEQGQVAQGAAARADRSLPDALARKRKAYRVRKLASTRAVIAGGHSKTLKLTLNTSGRAQLKRLHKLKLLILVARKVGGKTKLVLDRDATFTAPAAKKKKR